MPDHQKQKLVFAGIEELPYTVLLEIDSAEAYGLETLIKALHWFLSLLIVIL